MWNVLLDVRKEVKTPTEHCPLQRAKQRLLSSTPDLATRSHGSEFDPIDLRVLRRSDSVNQASYGRPLLGRLA